MSNFDRADFRAYCNDVLGFTPTDWQELMVEAVAQNQRVVYPAFGAGRTTARQAMHSYKAALDAGTWPVTPPVDPKPKGR